MTKLIPLWLILFPLLALAVNHSDSIPYPFYSEDTSGDTQMMPLHRGEEALQLRLELIRKAQKSIDVEYYIYHSDMAGKIFNRELVKAARRGVKVRILVDKFSSGFNYFIAHELAQEGIEVRYYNTNVILKLGAINFRNHRKLFVVDAKEAITGGRNLADDYFNLDKKYNFEDRDIYVKGPIVTAMKDSFEAFFTHELSRTVKRPDRPELRSHGRGGPDGRLAQRRWDREVKEAKEFLSETEEEVIYRRAIERTGNLQLEENNIYPCPQATFVSDAPGKRGRDSREDYIENKRNVRKTFLDKILPVDKAMTLSTPYFIPNDRLEFLIEDLLNRGVEFNLYSNSLRSTDQLITSAALYMHLGNYLKQGMKVFFHDHDWTGIGDTALEHAKTSGWGTHDKTHVYETSTYTEIMVGTYNIDNRSDYFNTELALFCKGNDDLSGNIKDSIMLRAQRGIRVETLKHAVTRNGEKINITGASPLKRLKMRLFTIPSWLMGHLL